MGRGPPAFRNPGNKEVVTAPANVRMDAVRVKRAVQIFLLCALASFGACVGGAKRLDAASGEAASHTVRGLARDRLQLCTAKAALIHSLIQRLPTASTRA